MKAETKTALETFKTEVLASGEKVKTALGEDNDTPEELQGTIFDVLSSIEEEVRNLTNLDEAELDTEEEEEDEKE